MADGVRFDIAIEANGLGVDATADSLNALAEKVTFTNKVATEFDRAVAAVRTRLAEATSVTKAASAALGTAEARYKELESAANKAAKEVEKAALAGKSTKDLTAAATAAASAMKAQAATVDSLRAKADAAAASQSKLAGTLKTLEGQQAAQAAAIKSGINKELAGTSDKMKQIGGGAADLKKAEAGVGGLHKATALTAAGWIVFAAAIFGAVGAMAHFAVTSNPAAMARLGAATERFKLGLKNLFSGLKLDGFVKAVEDILSLFDKGTSSANGMKAVVETLLQPLFDAGAKAGPFIKEMFKGMVFGVLQVVIAVLTLRNNIFKAMSPETRAAISSVVAQVFTLENAFKTGSVVAIVLAVIFGVLTVALIALAVAEIAALWPLFLVIAAIAAVIAIFLYWGEIVDWLSGVWDSITTFVKAIPGAWIAAAKAMIDGIVNGIKNGAKAVWDAMTNLAGGAIDAFKGKLGIKSPSAVMQLQANYTTAGFVGGLEDGQQEVDAAMNSLVTVPEAGKPEAGGTTGGGGAKSVRIEVVNIGNSPVAKSNFDNFMAALTEWVDGGNITIGGGEAPAT